jgi:hypothetical protein
MLRVPAPTATRSAEWYVNGGVEVAGFYGYDFGTIGNPREIGASVRFTFE